MTHTALPPSEELKHLQKLFGEHGIPPQNIVEFYVDPDQEEPAKTEIRTKTNGHCYFFTKPLAERIHVIAFVNVKDIAVVIEKAMAELADKEWRSSVSVASVPEGNVPAETEF